jgi:2-polyprenyl-3-methyl-5-hydroxy-6-metoxy-1,4-benzoquinol methylase
VSVAVTRYRLGTLGLTSGDVGRVDEEYALKGGEDSSHAVILRWLEKMPPARILDLGCSGGLLSERLRALGHRVTGVDILELPSVRDRVDHFIQADLDKGLPSEVRADGPYDVVLAADVLEHVRVPELVLEQSRDVLAPQGVLVASVPNIGHWYARGRMALGVFDYDQRGILDSGHVRFFTRRGFLRRLRAAGFTVVRSQATGLPLDALSGGDSAILRTLHVADRLAVSVRPTLFGYQFVCRCVVQPSNRALDYVQPQVALSGAVTRPRRRS